MAKSYNIIYTSDLHGNFYEELLQKGSKKNIDSIIIGGDILPKKGGEGYYLLKRQEDFIINYLIPRLEEFKKQCDKPPYLMMGNDDFACNMDLLKEAEKQGLLKLLHNRTYNLTEDIKLRGYGYVPITPFGIKDWEKWDTWDRELSNEVRFDGYRSIKDDYGFKLELVDLRDDNICDSIESDLEKLVKGVEYARKSDLEKLARRAEDVKKTIFVIHTPPYDTKLDMVFNRTRVKHVGSVAVRRFIERYQPLATLHGHVHESAGIEKIGKTICVNPGQNERKFHYLTFNICDIENSIKLEK